MNYLEMMYFGQEVITIPFNLNTDYGPLYRVAFIAYVAFWLAVCGVLRLVYVWLRCHQEKPIEPGDYRSSLTWFDIAIICYLLAFLSVFVFLLIML